jgi:tetratricopeptide (TPR) repeat protein/predicted Ser/Thr protein kinase
MSQGEEDNKRERESADTIPVRPGAGSDHGTPEVRVTQSDTMDAVAMPAGSTDPVPTGLHEHGVLGRFTILDTLGAGGMGVVVAAYDPQLDRKVAIKVLRTRGLTAKRRDKEAARLLREARSMAQLSHPHVVTVYEAGTIDERVFIAMEYIPGQTLRRWLAESKRSVAQILDRYLKAGRGLAAGHHAGLIHRDFKPDNVLVGYDGRVRVIDFGLARPTRASADTPTDDPEIPSSQSSELLPLTTAGALFGTPMYMSPEQHQKLELDARADQFAFCVSLFEALYARMPFPATSYPQLSDAVISGKLERPDDNPEIPTRVVDALMRGLRPQPDERFPSMDMLLDELEPPASRRRRGIVIASAVLGALGAAAITLVVMRVASGDRDAVDPCAGGRERIAGVWDPATQQAVKTAFLASNRTHAADTFDHVQAALDSYTGSWVEQRKHICEATKVRNEQSDSAFDFRMQCLGKQLAELSALTALFKQADVAITDNAVSAARGLASPASCATIVPGVVAPPTPAQLAQLTHYDKDMAEVRANIAAGVDRVALTKAKALLENTKSVGDLDVDADTWMWLGIAQSRVSDPAEAEKSLRKALSLSARAKDDPLTAQIWTTLIAIVGHQLARYNDALALQQVAEVAIERVDSDILRGQLAYQMGTVHFTKGEYKLANESFELALKLRTKELGVDHFDLAVIHDALGGSYLRSGNIFGAKGEFEKALAIDEKFLGPNHPAVALPLSNLGSLSQAMGMYDDATKYHLRALKILEEVQGTETTDVGLVLYSLAVSANGRENYKGALPYYERALKIFEKAAPDHPMVGLALVGLADCHEEVGEAAQAVGEGERGLALVLKGSSDPVQLALARYALAKALWSSNRDRPRARALMAEARKGFEAGGLLALNGLVAVDNWFKKIDKK